MGRTRRLRVAVAGTKLAVVGAVAALTMGVGSGSATTVDPGAAADQSQTAGQAHLDRLMSKHSCSTTGFSADVIPGSAIVERGSRYVFVSFDEGWATYTGSRPGTLVAVCRDNV